MRRLLSRYHKVSYGMPLTNRRAWHSDAPTAGDNPGSFYDELSDHRKKQSAPQIDWSSIDVNAIPADLVRSHPDYKNLLSESIERRHTIKELKEQMEAVPPAPPVEKTEETEPAQEETPSGDDEVPAYVKALMAQISGLTEVVQGIQASRVADTRSAILAKYGIPEALQALIPEGEPAVMEQAAQLIKGNLVASPPEDNSLGAGADGAGDVGSQFKTELMAELTGQNKKNLFTPGQQRRLGGGPVIN